MSDGLDAALGRSGAFWLYGGIGILTLIFCWKLVPATKGKRLGRTSKAISGRGSHAASPGTATLTS